MHCSWITSLHLLIDRSGPRTTVIHVFNLVLLSLSHFESCSPSSSHGLRHNVMVSPRFLPNSANAKLAYLVGKHSFASIWVVLLWPFSFSLAVHFFSRHRCRQSTRTRSREKSVFIYLFFLKLSMLSLVAVGETDIDNNIIVKKCLGFGS